MLVLSRKSQESVTVKVGNTAFTIQVTKLGSGTVRLGFDAPREVQVIRTELLEASQPPQPVIRIKRKRAVPV